jgi:hypothetical protein
LPGQNDCMTIGRATTCQRYISPGLPGGALKTLRLRGEIRASRDLIYVGAFSLVTPGANVESPRSRRLGPLMGAKHGAQYSAVWTSDSAVVLMDGIEASEPGRRLAEVRLRSLHPISEGKRHYSTDFEKRLRKIFDKQTGDHAQPWLVLEFWQQEIDNVLVQGIFSRNGSKSSVVARIHAVWPELSATWLQDRMEEVARAGLPQWVQNEFWAAEVDSILLVGIDRANRCRRAAIDRVLKASPSLQFGVVSARVRSLRNQRSRESTTNALADTSGISTAARGTSTFINCSNNFRGWDAVDPILIEGIRKANQCEREVVDKALGEFSELRIAAIWARLRRLRYKQKAVGPLEWTEELEERLIRVYQAAGLSASVSDIQNETDWPRRAILRRAHKLGVPAAPLSDRHRWTMAEFRFALESVNHLSIREIADELERSEKAVWDMVGSRGIPARFQDGYGVRELSEKLHIRRPSIRKWIKSGLLHKKRNGRIAEDSLQSFLHNHPERINWTLLDEDTTFWVSEILEAERIRVNGSGTRTLANSRNLEKMRAAGVSMSDGKASSAPEADPCAGPGLHNNRVRGASHE